MTEQDEREAFEKWCKDSGYASTNNHQEAFHYGYQAARAESRQHEEVLRAALHEICNSMRSAEIKYRQTAPDPKTNGYGYIEIADWRMYQLLGAADAALVAIAASAPDEQGDGK